MTLQEAKDQVAELHGLENWATVIMVYGYVGKWVDEACEMYARSKWDEAATLTNRNIIHHTNLTMKDLPAKPEFR